MFIFKTYLSQMYSQTLDCSVLALPEPEYTARDTRSRRRFNFLPILTQEKPYTRSIEVIGYV